MLNPQVNNAIPYVENFLRHCVRRDYKARGPIIKRGDRADTLYLRRTTRKFTDLDCVDVPGRIAHVPRDLCKEPDAMTHPDGVQIKVTRQELGEIVGCSRGMAGRVLRSLQE